MFDKKAIQEMLESAKPAVIESLKEELKGSVTREAKQEVIQMVRQHVKEWVQENIIPEITSSLIESKDGIISAGVKMGQGIAEELSVGMTQLIKENMESTWKRQEFFKALLR